MKIVFSRKGFDGANGGCASPIFPDGSMVSLPIPARGARPCFEEISFRGISLGPVVEDLSGGVIGADCGTHLDPDLRASAMERSPQWRPLFGQAGAAQSHLANQGVGIGDLFLFFGWFRAVEYRAARLAYLPNAPHLHVLFGWLQVGAVIAHPQADPAFPWARCHPHFQYHYPANNTVYVAAEQLSLDGHTPGLPGAEAFDIYDEALCLTAHGCRRGTWRLPEWFYPQAPTTALSYHRDGKRWNHQGDSVLLRTVGRGQEFVLDSSHYPELLPWVRQLIVSHACRNM